MWLDLTKLFNWNVKQLFLYATVSYKDSQNVQRNFEEDCF